MPIFKISGTKLKKLNSLEYVVGLIEQAYKNVI
jgi:predicted transport protein